MSRNFKIALIASAALHIFWMSAVVIINPAAMEKVKPYTSVNFLGPLLNKTAFDIMLEGIDPVMSTTYAHVPIQTSHSYLRAEAPKRRPPAEKLSRHNVAASDKPLAYFLAADKSIPNFLFQTREFPAAGYRLSGDKKDRAIIYRPMPPVLIPGSYGSGDVLRIKVRSLVSKEGFVKRTEPVTTTGYPELDIQASKYAGSWIFESAQSSAGDIWVEVEVILTTGGDDDKG